MTIISNSRQFIFVHLHKCGGTSVRQALRRQVRWNDLLIGGDQDDDRIERIYRDRYGLEKHNSADQLHAIVGDAVWRRYWTFALVRHPAAVVESFYHWGHRVILRRAAIHGITAEEAIGRIRSGEFEDEAAHWGAVNACARGDDFAGFVRYAIEHNCLGFGKTLSERLTDRDGRLVDSVFKLEQCDRFVEALRARTGLEIELGHTNRSANRQAPWTPELLDLVYRRYREDYDNFDYPRSPEGIGLSA